jgi:ABC-2 type transport system permease protein
MANNIVNLIRKDFWALWSERTMGPMLVVLLAISAIFASYLDYASLLFVVFTAFLYTHNAFSLDEKFRTEKLFASLPVRRRDIVLARYGGMLVIAGAYFVVAYLANVVSILIRKGEVRTIPMGYCATVLVIMAFMTSFSFPFYFRLGLARAKPVTMLLFGIIMVSTTVMMIPRQSGGSHEAMKVISAILNSPFPRDLLHTLLLTGVAILLWAVSIPVAVALYSKRDL